MKFLFISETFPDADHPTTGTYNLALCRELARDHEVRVISPRSWVDVLRGKRYRMPAELRHSGIEVRYPTRWYTPNFAQKHYGGQMWWSIGGALRDLTHDWKPDAVLSYWAHPDGECGLRASQKFGAPCAVIVGGTDVLILPNMPGRGPCVRRVLTDSDAVITVSDGLKTACDALGAASGRVVTIRQGIDPDVFHVGDQAEARRRLGLIEARASTEAGLTNSSDPLLRSGTLTPSPSPGGRGEQEALLVWVGRMVGLKRVDLLIQATRMLKEQGRRVRVCLLGSGPCRDQWQQLAQSEGVADQIQFMGPVSHDQLADWYRAADLTVLCSESEGLPNVLRESVACGTPFVSTDVGSIKEIADPDYSELVPKHDAAALARGIETVLSGPHRAAAQNYQPRTWSETARDTVSLFEELIASRKSQGLQPLGVAPSLTSHP